MMNIFEIIIRIGQRPPFQMIEKVLELEPNVSARGIKNVSINEALICPIRLTPIRYIDISKTVPITIIPTIAK